MKISKKSCRSNTSKKLKILLGLILFIQFTILKAQHNQVNYPLNRWSSIYLDNYLAKNDSLSNSGLKPHIIKQKSLYELPGFKPDTGLYYFNVTKKLYGDNLIVLDKEDMFVTIDPILHIELGFELRDGSTYADTANNYINTRGFNLRGSIGKKLSFETYFSENQIFVPLYQRERILSTRVAPGATVVKTFQTNGFDFGYAGGFISYQTVKNWNIQLGHGKHFIGEGYRSVILSDNTSPYPFMRSTLDIANGKLQVTNLFSIFQNLNRLPRGDSPESLYERKSMSLTTLSVSPIKEIKLSVSEGMIWQTFLRGEGDLNFDPKWINPLPFYNLATSEWDLENNLFLAFDLAFKPIDKITLYGQYMIDDPDTDRSAFQFGMKMIEPINGLWIRAEYNQSNHYTGAHAIPLQGLTHNNLPLAHPLGAGFKEYMFQASYKWERWFADLSYQRAKTDRGSELGPGLFENSGVDLLQSYPTGMTPVSSLFMANLNSTYIRTGYKFNSFYNLMVYFAYQHRDFKNDLTGNEKNGLISFGVKTELFNQYYDF